MEKMLVNTVKEENLASAIEDFAVLAYEIFHSLEVGFKIAKNTFSASPNDAVLKCENAIHRLLCNSSVCFDTTYCSDEDEEVLRLTICDEVTHKEVEYIASELACKKRGAIPLTRKVLVEQLFKLYDDICSDIKLIEELSGFEFTKEYHYVKDNLSSLINDYLK